MTENIGKRISQIRTQKEITLPTLAERSTITQEQLEQIEAGTLIPSISTLIRIARSLEIRLGTILDGEENTLPAMHLKETKTPTISLSNSNARSREHLDFFALAHQKSDRHMDPFIINVLYSTPGESECSQHEGEEFIYVLSGEVELRYGAQIYPLSTGDSIYYDSIVPHCLSTPDKGKHAQVLAIVYMPI